MQHFNETTLSDTTRQWLEQNFKSNVKEVKPLLGGTSSRLWLLTLAQENNEETVVLREYTVLKWLEEDPEIAEQEARNLISAECVPVQTPEFLLADPYAFKTVYPTVVMSYVEGEVVLEPADPSTWVEEMAITLARLHSNETEVYNQYFRYVDPAVKVTAEWSKHPKAWQEAFSYLNTTKPPVSKQTFIHRDFHPTNILFKGTEVAGVIDWTDACMGPREFDVAHCRWNLTMLHGLELADDFLKAYLKHSTLESYDPYWDLEASLNVFSEETPGVYAGWEAFGRTNVTPEDIKERMDLFVVQALNKRSERTPILKN